ncbi:MAG: hypothetical protein LBL32_01020, partial [Holosporales bacterium]|nr:hypothetical protein [Holosporales bacterium]
YGEVTISTEGDDLIFSNGIQKTKLEHMNGDTFTFPCKNICPHYFDADEYLTFIQNESGHLDSIYVSCFSENNSTFIKVKK